MWQDILTILKNPTSNFTIIFVVTILVIVPNFPKIAKYVPFLKAVWTPKVDYEKIATNHMHQMPEVLSKLNTIENGMSAMIETQTEQGKILIKHETLLGLLVDNKIK